MLQSLPIFWRRFFIVLTGTGLAQVIPLAAMPILTRLVPPAELGPYFIWLGVVTVLSVIFSLRLDVAVFNTRTPQELSELLQTSVICAVTLAGLAYVGLEILSYFLPEIFFRWNLNQWRIEALILATVWSVNMVAQNAYIYGAHFKRQAVVKVAQAASVAAAQITAAWSDWGVQGIILMQTIVTGVIVLWNAIDVKRKLRLEFSPFNKEYLKKTFREHWRFPIISMPADFISSLSGQLPVFLLGNRVGAAPAGQLSLTNKALAAPMKLLAGSILAVFKEEAARQYRETGQCRDIFLKTLKALILIGILPFTGLFFFSGVLFEFVFGAQWRDAGEYASILAPMFFMQFVSSPLSYVLYLANKQFSDLIWQIAMIAMTALIFISTENVIFAIKLYSLGCSFLYGLYIYISYKHAISKNIQI
ncbi:oligosaccharide flippase family protein [Acidovorax sp. 210-6]|uniref:lipopolysaccharide biosynthesis protein n=1 Tax=Acidovorax sp. 210-6 TaxID=2699468 RepID=UPI002412FA0C|nr:oligosaccharide flippase family protein [Acidovorax sp. 210-6]